VRTKTTTMRHALATIRQFLNDHQLGKQADTRLVVRTDAGGDGVLSNLTSLKSTPFQKSLRKVATWAFSSRLPSGLRASTKRGLRPARLKEVNRELGLWRRGHPEKSPGYWPGLCCKALRATQEPSRKTSTA